MASDDARTRIATPAVELQRERVTRSSSRSPTTSTCTTFVAATSDAGDRLCRREDRGHVQPRRPAASRSSRTTTCFVTSDRRHRRERPLTSDGSAELLNGTLDWVYSEELYGRGTSSRLLVESRLVTTSPSSSSTRRACPEYTLVDDISVSPGGRALALSEGRRSQSRRCGSASSSPLGWPGALDRHRQRTPTSSSSMSAGRPTPATSSYQIQDRQQTWLDLNRADAATGRRGRLLRETSKAWVERWQDSSVDPIWLKDGSFLWLSERSGWRHFYHYTADGIAHPAGHAAANGKSGARMGSIRPGRGSISRRRRTARSVSTCIAFGSTASELQRISTVDGTPSGRSSIRRARCFSIRGATSRRRRRFVCIARTRAKWSASSTRIPFRR